MGSFKTFLQENSDDTKNIASDDDLAQIQKIINTMEPDELDEFGEFLYDEFFDKDEDGDADEMFFGADDIMDMINDLGPEMFPDILDMLSEVPDDNDLENDDGEIPDEDVNAQEFNGVSERVSRIMLSKNRNRKKRKYMTISKAKFKQTVSARKRKNRLNKNKVKRYYRANKAKIKAYQKSRALAIKSGKHIVKLRKNGG